MRPSLPFLLLATLVAIANAETAPWTAVPDVNDKTVQQVGEFAVRMERLSKSKQLTYVNVVSGLTQRCDGGYNYRLVVTAAGPGPGTAQYDAFIWGIPGTMSWKLWSFTSKY